MMPCIRCGQVHDTTACPSPTITYYPPLHQQGWECPKCHTIFAPHVNECHKCRPAQFVITTFTPDSSMFLADVPPRFNFEAFTQVP